MPRLPAELSEQDLRACETALRHGSRSFFVASLALPPGFRSAVTVLYAFCRDADDLIDCSDNPQRELAGLHARLDAMYVGESGRFAPDRALISIIQHFELPRELLDALIEGFEWDVEGRTYDTLDDVYAYATRVAGTVGVMMAVLMGVRSATALARACDLGIAMQLTNIARDVGEDARIGRVYLPENWLQQEGLSREQLVANPVFSEALGRVIKRLLACAEQLYKQADSGIAVLPAGCRPAIYAARLLYSAIGDKIASFGYDSVSQRAIVGRAAKMLLLAKLPGCSVLSRQHLDLPCVEPAAYLVEAASVAEAPERPSGLLADLDRQIAGVFDLFDELDRRNGMLPVEPVEHQPARGNRNGNNI